MSKQSPLHRVREDHGSKAELVKKVAGILEPWEEEERTDFEKRVAAMSNQKLLRLWDANETVSKKWGSRDALISAITSARFSGGNADYAAKLGTYSLPRLIDLARQHGV